MPSTHDRREPLADRPVAPEPALAEDMLPSRLGRLLAGLKVSRLLATVRHYQWSAIVLGRRTDMPM